MKPIHVNADQPTDIGNVGEKNARIIDFALPAGWQDYATTANTVAVFILPKTTLPVPYDVEVSNGSAHWLIKEYCTSAKGSGKVQLVLLTDATLADVVDENGYFNANAEQIRAKSDIYDTICHPSAVESVPVNPSSPLFDHMMDVARYFDNLPEKVPNKYFGTDADKKWCFKDGGGSPGGSVAFVDITGQPEDNANLRPKIAQCSNSDISEIFA